MFGDTVVARYPLSTVKRRSSLLGVEWLVYEVMWVHKKSTAQGEIP